MIEAKKSNKLLTETHGQGVLDAAKTGGSHRTEVFRASLVLLILWRHGEILNYTLIKKGWSKSQVLRCDGLRPSCYSREVLIPHPHRSFIESLQFFEVDDEARSMTSFIECRIFKKQFE
jgi:hypothetical protein